MSRLFGEVTRLLLSALLVVFLLAGSGCGPDQSIPNPDLKVPDVPPSSSQDAGKSGMQPGGPRSKGALKDPTAGKRR